MASATLFAFWSLRRGSRYDDASRSAVAILPAVFQCIVIGERLRKLPGGASPRTLAIAGEGLVWTGP